jgi:hypothetical protein
MVSFAEHQTTSIELVHVPRRKKKMKALIFQLLKIIGTDRVQHPADSVFNS